MSLIKSLLRSVKDGINILNVIILRVEELNQKANPEIIISILGNKIDLDSH